MFWYVWASLAPAALLAAACLTGGPLTFAALGAVTMLVYGLDRISSGRIPARDDAAARRGAAALCVALAGAHFLLLVLGVRALTGAVPLSPAETAALYVGLGVFFGQISNSNAHELIHARSRWRFGLGAAIYASLLFGHHVSAHLRVHHIWVATDRDPNSARPGEGFYRFWPRAWIGSFRAGLRAENALRARRAAPPPVWRHPYAAYLAGAAATLAGAAAIGGGAGVVALLALAIYTQMQLLISDYVQHYGLRRAIRADGRAEPVGPAHSWNAAPWYSAAMMLNAPRHSDHHMNPARPFPALRLRRRQMPVLPSTFPLMGLVATIPPLWRRIMDPKIAEIHHEFYETGEANSNLADSAHDPPTFDSAADPDAGQPARRAAGGHGGGGI